MMPNGSQDPRRGDAPTRVVLSGNNDAKWRERIGNMVPPLAAQRVFEQITLALLQNALGETFVLGGQNTNIWVNPTKNIIPRRRPANLYGIGGVELAIAAEAPGRKPVGYDRSVASY